MKFIEYDVPYGIELKFTRETLWDYKNNDCLSPLANILTDYDAFNNLSLIIDTLDILPYIRLTISCDNALLSVKYDISSKSFDISIELKGNGYIYELQDELCSYVLWLCKQLFGNKGYIDK